jgi:hypothetical protein
MSDGGALSDHVFKRSNPFLESFTNSFPHTFPELRR